MNLNQINVGQITAQITNLARMIAMFCLAVLIAATLLGRFHIFGPYIGWLELPWDTATAAMLAALSFSLRG